MSATDGWHRCRKGAQGRGVQELIMPADTQEQIHDDDTVEFPELDEGSDDEAADDFGAEQLAFEEDGTEDATQGLEEGIDDPVELELDAGEERTDWTAGAEDATDLLDQDLDLFEPADSDQEDLTDDSEGLLDSGAEIGLITEPEDNLVADDGDEGLELDPADELPRLPQLGDSAGELDGEEGSEGDDSWVESISLPPLPGDHAQDGARDRAAARPAARLDHGNWVAVAPGIRWRRLTGVEQTQLARPQGRSELGLHAISGGRALVYLGQLYRLEHETLRPVRAMGLRPNPLALCAAGGASRVLWALYDHGAQLSQDGGKTFSPPVPLPRRRGSVRGATTADGTLWLTRDGELFRLGVGDLAPRAVACEEPPVEIASDGELGLLVVGATGRVFASQDGGRRFTVWPGPESLPQSVQLCGNRGLLMAAGGWVLINDEGYRHLFAGSAQLGTLALSHSEQLDVYAFVRGDDGWHLVRMPTDNRTSRASVVVATLSAEVGAPRFLLVFPARDSTEVLVGADQAFVHLHIPTEGHA